MQTDSCQGQCMHKEQLDRRAPISRMSQLMLMLATCAMHMAMPMMTAHTATAIRDTITRCGPSACMHPDRCGTRQTWAHGGQATGMCLDWNEQQ